MRKPKVILVVSLILTLFGSPAFSKDLSAVEILKKTDEVVNASKDMRSTTRTILIDSNKNEKVRESETFQKGNDKRLVRFLSPADQKGIGFLSLPDDVQYLYLPAFRKVRRIASSIKNTNFASTDFTYEDLSTFEYSKDYDPKLIETTDTAYVLELTPKPGVKKEYSKLRMWIRKDNFYPVKTESYDKKGTIWKVLERRRIEKVGNYWISKEMEMKDLKVNHSTKIIVDKIEFDSGLDDEIFTPRYLSRTN